MTSKAESNGRNGQNGSNGFLEFRRLEVKYLVDRTRRTALTRDLQLLMRPDPHAGPTGAYMVRSLYFDTADYMAYHEKLAGTAQRHKLRMRAYGQDASQAKFVRLEVKSRYLNFIYKIARDVPREVYAQVERALAKRMLPPAELLENGTLPKEFFRLQRMYNMEPRIIVEYRRQAFERLEASRTRINLDDELWASRSVNLLGPLDSARPVLQRGHAILEIKVDGVMPKWVHMLISKYDLQAVALSKYCYATRSEARMSSVGRPEDLVPFRLEHA